MTSIGILETKAVASSNVWALVGGVVVVGGSLAGAVAWRHAHPDAASPLAALAPMIPQLAPATVTPLAASAKAPLATTAPSAKVPPPSAQAPPSAMADRGLEPPSVPHPNAPAASQSAEAPTFDVVRVEPSGDTVVAGKAAPGADVALLASGQVVAEGKADSNGQFVLIPPALKPGNYDLSLRQKGSMPQDSKQDVAVAVPEKGKTGVVVALAEPGKPTKVLSNPVTPPPAAGAPDDKGAAPATSAAHDTASGARQLAIRSVELENGTGFFASGNASPGQQIHVYLNDSHIADVTAAADGTWTLRIGKGMTGGHYKVRADAVGPDGRTVVARVEVPFDVPTSMAQTAPPAAKVAAASSSAAAASDAPAPLSALSPAPAPAAAPVKAAVSKAAVSKAAVSKAAVSNAVVASVDTALVARGDNLWDISRTRLGDGTRYTRIYTANAAQIRNPNLIYPGQVFVVPHD